MTINVICGFQPPHNWILIYLYLIGDTSVCKTNLVKLLVPLTPLKS